MRGMDRVLVGLIAALAPWMDRSSEDRTAELDARVARLEPALDDKDELVRTASAEALQAITNERFGFKSGLPEEKRDEIRDRYTAWWGEHENEVREKLAGGR